MFRRRELAEKTTNADNERFKDLSGTEQTWFDVHTTENIDAVNSIRVHAANITLMLADMSTLRGSQWINDEIINSFAALLNTKNSDYFHHSSCVPIQSELRCEFSSGDRSWVATRRPRTFMFSSFFFTCLMKYEEGYDYTSVKKWTERAGVDVMRLDLILFPVNLDNAHWILAAIDLRAREYIYIDSLGNDDICGVLEVLIKWLADEVRDNHGEDALQSMNTASWTKVINPKYAPKQQDNASCGIFVIYTADYLELRRKIDFMQKHISILRKRTAFFLSRNRLADHPQE